MVYFLLPPLIWIALRFSIIESVLSLLFVAIASIYGTILSYGPFVRDNANESLFLLQSFNGITAITILIILTIFKEKERARDELNEHKKNLETLVEERTQELERSNKKLIEVQKELKDKNLHLEDNINFELLKNQEQEKLLKATNDKLLGLYELSPLGIALTDMEGNYLEFNDAFKRICGYTKEELKRLDYWKLTPQKYEKEEQEQLLKLEKTGFYGPYEKEYLQKTGKLIPVNLNGMIIMGKDSKKYVWSIVEDISARKNTERVLASQSKLASMGEMIGNIAHQWRQPLSVITTSISGLNIKKEIQGINNEDIDFATKTILSQANYLSRTIDDFRNFLKGDREKSKFKVTDEINRFMHLIESSIDSHDINVIIDIHENIEIYGYKNELIQCFINIFNNAKDAYKNDSSKRYLFISSYIKNQKVYIEFKDNAQGIPKDIIDRIFEPYFTTKHQSQGTGLGLNIVYNFITTGMNGTIQAKNIEYTHEKEHLIGAKFIIKLPLH